MLGLLRCGFQYWLDTVRRVELFFRELDGTQIPLPGPVSTFYSRPIIAV